MAVMPFPRAARATRLPRRRRVFVNLLWAVLVSALAALVAALSFVRSVASGLPDVSQLVDLHRQTATRILSSDGVTLATLRAENRRPVPLDAISPYLQQATVAVEDHRFYAHGGVDARGTVRALWRNARRGDAYAEGGSTLTQQLARNLFLTHEKSYRRKVAEVLLARRIEATHSKRAILEAYLNTVYYGAGAYGAEAAARTYFGKPARDLNLSEAALLAGLPQRPAALSPFLSRDAARNRQREVLARMVTTGDVTPEARAVAEATPLRYVRLREQTLADARAPYFVADVIKQVRARFGDEFLLSGATIVTTLNWKMQHAAEQSVKQNLALGRGPTTAALVSIDPRTGYVRALVGGADFRRDQFNAATQGIRQPGSAFKPLVYATAFDLKLCTLVTQFNDVPTTYSGRGKAWTVRNYGRTYAGQVDTLTAVRQSINTVAVKVAEMAGPEKVADYARRLGIATPLQADLPLALGASGVRPLELCSAYTAFANGGNRYEPTFLLRVTDASGGEHYADGSNARLHENFFYPRTLSQINAALREVVNSGTAHGAASVPDARGKTGTTSDHRDTWFVGYTPELVTAVWAAHPERTKGRGGKRGSVTHYLPMPGASGGGVCVPVWRDFMARAVPEQRRVNLARGIAPAPLDTPDVAHVVAALRAEAAQVAREKAAEKEIEAEALSRMEAAERLPEPAQTVSYAVPAAYGAVAVGEGTSTAASAPDAEKEGESDVE